MPWLEWCPDPQQPDAQWVKIFHPGSWTPQDEHDAPPPPHTYRKWKEFSVPNPDQEGAQPNNSIWYKRDWATEGYRRVAAPQAGHDFDSLISIAWPRNPRLCVCHRKCWMRLLDHQMRRLSPLRISLVFKMGSLNCRIARVMHLNNTNQYVHLVEVRHQSLLGSLIHTCLRPNHAAPPPRRSLSSS